MALALKGKIKMGNVNCDKYSGMCTRAAITGYPTVRFYRGQDKGDMQDYFSEDIKDREQDKIVRVVELLVQRSQGDQDKKNEKEDQDSNEYDEHGDNDYEHHEYYEDDEDEDGDEHGGHDEL